MAGWLLKGPRAVAENLRGVVVIGHELVACHGHRQTISGVFLGSLGGHEKLV